MACRFEYKGKQYSQDELAKELEKMLPHEAAPHIEGVQSLPDMPFKKTWDELALKNMIRKAAEGGYDSISWTPGEAQAARYDLSKQVEGIQLSKSNNQHYLLIQHKGGKNSETITLGNNTDKLADYVGKEAAEKLLAQKANGKNEVRTLEGLDLKVGGEGMKAFYDKMLVDKANAIAKKFGGKVEQKEITAPKGKPTQHANFEEWQNAPNETKQTVHVLRITPQMRKHVLTKGFPLFSGGLPVITPVSHDPFKHKLTPVDHNPFTNPNAT